ncbi:MAG: hypothetical protein K2Q22_02065, partial [Cytophagales bacterium]|nr:hypothetical protein [Cytophagales bacterium]
MKINIKSIRIGKWKKHLLTSGILAQAALVMPALAQYSPTQPFKGKIGKTLAETTQEWPQYNPKAKEGAPNVIWILLDDVGYGGISTFGGLVETPNLDTLANGNNLCRVANAP